MMSTWGRLIIGMHRDFKTVKRRIRNGALGIGLSVATAFLSGAIDVTGQAVAAPPDISAEDRAYQRLFVLANTQFTLFHELAHVLIWELNLPVFGREEDAADNIALMGLMLLDRELPEAQQGRVVEKLQAVADGWELEWRLVEEDQLELAYWDLHSLEIQRYYNIACLVYGADTENREQIVIDTGLPLDRAEWCAEEYALAKNAMDWLLLRMSNKPELAFKNESGKVTVVYEKNLRLHGEKIDKWLHESRVAERLAKLLTERFSLPRDITISFEGCPFPNASWDVDKAKVQFCYALIERFMYLADELQNERAMAHADARPARGGWKTKPGSNKSWRGADDKEGAAQ